MAAGEGPVVARVARGRTSDDVPALLSEALNDELIQALLLAPNSNAATQSAVILAAVSPPAPADPRVIHELVDRLSEAGWDQVVVAVALSPFDRDRGYDDVFALAGLAGLKGRTERGTRYEIADLDSEEMLADVPESSLLSGRSVSKVWQDAGLKVTVARNVTDAADGYSLGLALLLGVAAPLPGATREDLAADLAHCLGPDLAIVDAVISSHGPSGAAALLPLTTATIVAGTDIVLVDVVGAELQGIDPSASALTAAALCRHGFPLSARIEGSRRRYDGWRPADPVLRRLSQPLAGTTMSRLLAAIQAPAAPDADPDDDKTLNALRRAAAWSAGIDQPGQRSLLAAAGSAADALTVQWKAWAAAFGKDRDDRVVVPLGFDAAAYSDADYDGVADFVEKATLELDGTTGEPGLRWRYVDEAVVFEAERVINAPFAEFAKRVDIAAGISLMADYLGGRRIALSHDDRERVTRQAERNVYLPQPNYTAAWGGLPIDVGKIERVEYGDSRQRLSWRTVISPNSSATYDDGSLSFAPEGDARTRVTVRGRQLFTLPPALAALHLERFPEIKNVLVRDAYHRFFTLTFDNLEACYEGREFRIGREPAGENAPLPTVTASTGLDLAREWLTEKPLRSRVNERLKARTPTGPEADSDGFRHFSGAQEPVAPNPGWGRRAAAEIAAAWKADRDRMTRP